MIRVSAWPAIIGSALRELFWINNILVFIVSKRGPLRVDRALTTAAKHGKWGKHILSTKTQN